MCGSLPRTHGNPSKLSAWISKWLPPVEHSLHRHGCLSINGHLILGGNRAAVDRLGESLKGVAPELPKATLTQPIDRNHAEMVEQYGVDDGFRIS